MGYVLKSLVNYCFFVTLFIVSNHPDSLEDSVVLRIKLVIGLKTQYNVVLH